MAVECPGGRLYCNYRYRNENMTLISNFSNCSWYNIHFLSLFSLVFLPYCNLYQGENCSFPCQGKLNCDVTILEQTDCEVWSCYDIDPKPEQKDVITISVGIGIAVILIIALILILKTLRHRICLSERRPRSENGEPQQTVENQNSYFSIGNSSSEEDLGKLNDCYMIFHVL